MEIAPELYRKFFIEAGIERSGLFKNVKEKYGGYKALYPGSFVHISPSFFFPELRYIDQDKRCKAFFQDSQTLEFVISRKEYDQDPQLKFSEMSFQEELDEEEESFDLLISQYSGFISKYCTRYLRRDGILLVNDSHGDATYAFHSGEFDFVAVVQEGFEIDESNLDRYFSFSRKKEVDMNEVLEKMKGPKYKTMADSYIFRRK